MDRHLLNNMGILWALYKPSRRTTLTGPTAHTGQIWHEAQRMMGWNDKITQATPLWDTKRLGRLRNTKGFSKWDLIGISKVGDIWKKGNSIPFDQLQKDYRLAQTETFRYMQIKHALQKALPHEIQLPEASLLEDKVLTEHLRKKAISLIYKKIINNQPDPMVSLKDRWETDLGTLDETDCQEALAPPREVAIPSKLRLIQLKILHQTHYTRTLIYKLGATDTPLCLRECGQSGIFFHTIWKCPKIMTYWEAIMNIISQVTGSTLWRTFIAPPKGMFAPAPASIIW